MTVRFLLKTILIILAFPAVGQAQMTLIHDNSLTPYTKGLDLFEKQKFGAAKHQFDHAIANVDDQNSEISANAHYYAAVCALELFHKDAEFLLRSFIRNYSTSTRVNDAWFLLGNFNYRKKKYDEALIDYNQIQVNSLEEPRLSEFLFKKGYSSFQLGDMDAAASQFFQMKDQNSLFYAPGVYYFGHINYDQGKYSAALKAFESLEGHPQFGNVVPYYIVQIFHFQEKYDDVVAYGKPFLESKDVKRKAEISRLVGEALYHKQRYAESIPYLEEFMAGRSAKEKSDYYVLGFAYYKTNRYDEAAEQFSKISYSEDLLGQNALYHMGESYLKANKKSYARNAYRSAANMSFDPQLKEDALFKYAQLSYELSYDPYDGAIAAFKEYITEYPKNERTKAAYDYLVNIYLTSKNYDAALVSIESYENPDIRLKEAYQRIAFNKGVELYSERNYNAAIASFDRSMKFPQNKIISSEATYWKAESLYYLGSYSESVKTFEAFIYSPGAALTKYFNLANYNIGYAYFQQEKFVEAPQWFRRFTTVRSEKDEVKLADANLRIGDCFYMMKQYEGAKEFYSAAVSLSKSDPDYSLYQLAMTEGFLGNYDSKLEKLNNLTSGYPKSRYLDAAYYEIGRLYISKGEDASALANLNKVVQEYPGSSYVRRALVSIGQTYYNGGKREEALVVFMRIIKDYPTYNDTREAINGVKSIYVDQGRIEEFEPLINSLSFVNFTDAARDSLMYEGAERQYFDQKCAEAVEAFTKYLDRFDKPNFSLNARFYRAECLSKLGRKDEAMKDYHFIADQGQNTFSESALLQVARDAFAKDRFPEALAHYKRLSLLAQYQLNQLESEVGQMRCNYNLKNYQGAISNALIALDFENVDPKIYHEANLTIAKSYLMQSNTQEADLYLEKVIMSGLPSLAAEASYLRARQFFLTDQLDSAEASVFNMVGKYKSEAIWIAKALILLSDVYITRGDVFQATATLQSILDNYPTEDEVKGQAREKLKNIQEMQSQKQEADSVDFEIYLSEPGVANPNK